MNKSRRIFTASAIAGALALSAGQSLAQAGAYPDRAIKMIVPFAAGGTTDIIARVVAQKLQEAIGQTVIVENRAGGGTLIGTRAALQAPADGYTILMASSTMATAPLLYRNPGYAVSDFALVAPVGSVGFAMSVNASVPANNLAELVSYAKANPGKLNIGSLGGGGATHLLGERFKAASGIQMTTIPYGGAAPAMKDLLGGVIQVFIDGITTTAPQISSGKIRSLAVTTENRAPLLSGVPTFKEQGFPTMVGGVWFALFVSEKTPAPIVEKLRKAGLEAATSPQVRERMVAIGTDPWMGSAQDFATYLRQDTRLWEEDIKRSGLPLID